MKPQSLVQHTSEVSTRRRALFPCDDQDTDPDLSCISPLNLDDDDPTIPPKDPFSLKASLGDYDIIGLVVKPHSIITPTNPNPVVTDLDKIVTPSTSDESPTKKLKTPHDVSDNTVFPKLHRSKPVEAVCADFKNPKVRTALFPELDMSLPSRTFYPKRDTEAPIRAFERSRKNSPKKARRQQGLYLCNRRSKYRCGQINAGVRHKIKKRKIKKISKIAALQAAINIIEKSPLNSFLEETQEAIPQPSPPPVPRDPTPSPEPDPTKRFFKSSRHRGIVTVNGNIRVEMNRGKLTLLEKKNPLKRARQGEGAAAKRPKLAEFDEEGAMPETNISNIIQSLEENKENGGNPENSPAMVLMSPTSQMCNMTSGLALNSPKKARDLSAVLEAMPNNNESPQAQKLFPVFYPGKTSVSRPAENKNSAPSAKKFKALSKDQMLLDAGQKRWGVTQCHECKIVYQMGDPGDELMHLNYHNAAHIFRFNGWKNERVVSGAFLDGKIVQVVPGDAKIWWKKVKEVIEVVNRDLGFYDIEFNTANSQIFFYVKNKTIVGVLVAEVRTTAHKLLTTHHDQVDLCSEESYPIRCGISRIWVAQHHRKRGIATAMMDALKRNFMFGHILMNKDVAFSSPTEMGKIFGRGYFKTPNFLIYFV